jgi:hypothetical protein
MRLPVFSPAQGWANSFVEVLLVTFGYGTKEKTTTDRCTF